MLHAELSSTLKRRKPVVINEPPKYEYPTYDDSNGNGSNGSSNSVNNKINDSSHSTTSVNIATPKPMNVNAVLSVVTGIKLPDTIQYDANVGNATAASASSTTDKRKISHGKPNFTINHQKENRPHHSPPLPPPSLPKASSPKINGGAPVDTKLTTTTTAAPAPAMVQPKLQRPSYFTNHSIGSDKTIVKTTPMARPAIDTNGTESGQVEKCRSIFMIKSQKSQDDSVKQITKCPLKSADSGVVKLTNASSSNGANEQPPKPKELLHKKISIDESSLSSSSSPLSNGISFASVANKKALFERSAPNENHSPKSPIGTLRGAQTEKLYFNKPVSSSSPSPPLPPSTPSASAAYMSNGKFNTLNGHRSNGNADRNQKPGGITTVTLNKSIPYGGNGSVGGGTLDRPKYERTPSTTKDAVDHFERSVHETATSKTTTTKMMEKTTTTTTNKYETKQQQFEQKTIVSFSKDLLNAPNNYPEQIRVKKTIINESVQQRSPAIADSPFHNIRFSIKTNGQVIPKAK